MDRTETHRTQQQQSDDAEDAETEDGEETDVEGSPEVVVGNFARDAIVLDDIDKSEDEVASIC